MLERKESAPGSQFLNATFLQIQFYLVCTLFLHPFHYSAQSVSWVVSL